MIEIYWGVDRYALQNFKGCHDRVRDGKCPSIFWKRDKEGYLLFCKEIGPKPTSMVKPSVGRIYHDKGYEPGNIRWEEYSHNSAKRRGTRHEGSTSETVEFVKDRPILYRKGTPEHDEFMRSIRKLRWSDPEQIEKARVRMLGNQRGRKKNER